MSSHKSCTLCQSHFYIILIFSGLLPIHWHSLFWYCSGWLLMLSCLSLIESFKSCLKMSIKYKYTLVFKPKSVSFWHIFGLFLQASENSASTWRITCWFLHGTSPKSQVCWKWSMLPAAVQSSLCHVLHGNDLTSWMELLNQLWMQSDSHRTNMTHLRTFPTFLFNNWFLQSQ